MKIVAVLEYFAASAVLMVYGWYLGQLHQSGPDLAGILMFMTGLLGFLIALGLQFLTRHRSWHDRWYTRVLTGIAGCAIVFSGLVLYARIHG